MKERIVHPEILDHLPPTNPHALRSRQDLRRLNLFLGNSRWIHRIIQREWDKSYARIAEIGAGEGLLCNRLAQALPNAEIVGLDFMPAPDHLAKGVKWLCGDFFQTLPEMHADVVIGSLVLHHFSDECLQRLGRIFECSQLLVFVEPYRSPLVLALSHLIMPFIDQVTQHDMPTSIRAGFRLGELAPLMGLDFSKWRIFENYHWRGTLRMIARRQ